VAAFRLALKLIGALYAVMLAENRRAISQSHRTWKDGLTGVTPGSIGPSSGGHTPASSEARGEGAGPFDPVVRAEMGPPSAVARHELCGRLRPPCAETEVAPKFSRRAGHLTMHDDMPWRRRLLRRELIPLKPALLQITRSSSMASCWRASDSQDSARANVRSR
jgi:hypothetical protein